MSPLKIAVLDMNNNHPNEGMRCILHIIRNIQGLEQAEVTFEVFNVRADNHLPDLGFDIYISSGGPGSPLPSDEEWEARFFALMDDILAWNREQERKKYVFLICHSFQLMVRHLGLGELGRRRSTSFGIFPIHKTPTGEKDPLLAGLPEPFYAVDSRDYQITKPHRTRIKQLGASVLCLEKIRPHVALERAVMAMRFSPEVVGTQFHPEADDEGMLRYFKSDEKMHQIVKRFGRQKYDDMVQYLQDDDKIALTEAVILPGFLQRSIHALLPMDEIAMA